MEAVVGSACQHHPQLRHSLVASNGPATGSVPAQTVTLTQAPSATGPRTSAGTETPAVHPADSMVSSFAVATGYVSPARVSSALPSEVTRTRCRAVVVSRTRGCTPEVRWPGAPRRVLWVQHDRPHAPLVQLVNASMSKRRPVAGLCLFRTPAGGPRRWVSSPWPSPCASGPCGPAPRGSGTQTQLVRPPPSPDRRRRPMGTTRPAHPTPRRLPQRRRTTCPPPPTREGQSTPRDPSPRTAPLPGSAPTHKPAQPVQTRPRQHRGTPRWRAAHRRQQPQVRPHHRR